MNNKIVRSFSIDTEVDMFLNEKSKKSNKSKSRIINEILKDWLLSQLIFNRDSLNNRNGG